MMENLKKLKKVSGLNKIIKKCLRLVKMEKVMQMSCQIWVKKSKKEMQCQKQWKLKHQKKTKTLECQMEVTVILIKKTKKFLKICKEIVKVNFKQLKKVAGSRLKISICLELVKIQMMKSLKWVKK